MLHKVDYNSPIGIIHITGTEQAVQSIMFTDRVLIEYDKQKSISGAVIDCYEQLNEYFQGKRKEFTFPYAFNGTNFQQTVWQALSNIPYAETCSYKELALAIGKEKAVRAVGSANGKNRLSIVLPCHRVIGASGKLTGYAGELWRKEWLLEHEKRNNV